jgi:cytochrome c
MNTLDERTLVSVKSCGGEGSGCHVEANTDGILNYEIEQKKTKANFQCTKCHIKLGTRPVPADHLEAIEKTATK